MIENVLDREQLRSLCRKKFKRFETKTVDNAEVEKAISEGWEVSRKKKNTTTLSRPKPLSTDLEDRVWSLFYRMGFSKLSGSGGVKLTTASDGDSPLSNQLDCVAIDHEVALVAECKASAEYARRLRLQEEITKLAALKRPIGLAVEKFVADDDKRVVITCMFLHNAQLSENDLSRAKENNVTLFDHGDLEYYEDLVSHLGEAARYQFLADLIPGRVIPSLKIKVPAIRLKFGGNFAYLFAISPSYLLKIAYVSHRMKGKGSDINTYQRMMKKSRLTRIREFIEEKGVFPTNIVVNVDPKFLHFYKTAQEHKDTGDDQSGILGWLDITPAYKSAWVIDGQHRLFGYAGSSKADKARLTVLSFAGLIEGEQAGMFISINSKQKSVKPSLLQELFAELHWDAEDPRLRVSAVISKTIQSIDVDKLSPFYGRIQTADASRDEQRCISLSSMFAALQKSDLFILHMKDGVVTEYGALAEVDNMKTLQRTSTVLNGWFKFTADAAPDWWAKGSGEGGGLAMNDSVVSLIGVLRSVMSHLADRKHIKLHRLTPNELLSELKDYGVAVGAYLASLNEEQRKFHRDQRGVQGITTRQRRMQQALRLKFGDFDPPGLEAFLRDEKAETNKRAKVVLDEIEIMLQENVVSLLKEEFGEADVKWWYEGVPEKIRTPVAAKIEQDGGARKEKERYFDLIHYREIIMYNWELLHDTFAYGKPGVGREKGTVWINELNKYRRGVAHPTSGITITLEQLAEIESYRDWLKQRIENPADPSAAEASKDEPAD